jgi:hypothetical protein
MKRTVASFGLASLSLLTSYVIVAAWPDKVTADAPVVAQVLPVETQAVPEIALKPTVVSLAD